MKKLFAVAALLIGLTPLSHAANPQAPVLQDQTGLVPGEMTSAQSLAFLGCVPFDVDQTTAPTLIVAGSGILYELAVTSGAATSAFAMAFDTSAVYDVGGGSVGKGNFALGLLQSGSVPLLPKGVALTPRIFTDNTGTTANTVAGIGHWIPAQPRRFVNGLVVANEDINVNTSGCYRSDAQDAALPVTK